MNIFIVIFSFGLMFTYYWKLAVIMLAIIPVYGLVYFITNKLNKKTQRGLMENAVELESQLVESLNSVATIKRFGLENFANIKTETRFIKLLKIVYRSGIQYLLGLVSFSLTGKELRHMLHPLLSSLATGFLKKLYSGYFY